MSWMRFYVRAMASTGSVEPCRKAGCWISLRSLPAVLRTYNPESPFVELALWNGSSCSDCGAGVDEDHSYSCAEVRRHGLQ